jgi:hypothetical protein
MSALGHAQTLRNVLENARYEHECAIEHLTVLDSQADPYRLDTPIHHLNAKWAARQVGRFFQTHERVHLRGLHYALVIQGNVRKPDGKIYRNTDDDWQWLVGRAMKAARWLGYIPFDRISDQRNSEPIIHRERAAREPTAKHLSASVWTGEVAFDLGPIHVSEPHGWLSGFEREQPYALAIFGEKASLEDILLPIAQRYGADLYLQTGEISDTRIHQMAKDASEDGRPFVVITVTDFDPSGRQMSVSIGRKLQAFRSTLFPSLRFEVVPAALTVEQVREFRLPSTPLKTGEQRADRWRRSFGVQQTEIDALIRMRPDDLRRIVETAIAPYYDRTLASRIGQAKVDWSGRAQTVIDAHVDADELENILDNVGAFEADAKGRIEEIKAEIEERVAVENDRLREMVAGIRLPRAPALPLPELAERPPDSVLISSEWTWTDGTLALKRHKSYGNEDSP